MNALARVVNKASLKGWTIPGSRDGGIFTESAVFAAAAEHPLIERGNDFVFDRKSFLNRVLEVAEPEGHA
jgi:hypothetical protein